MVNMPTGELLARYQEAFTRWDTAKTGTIDAGDMCEVLQFLGKAPSDGVQLMCEIFRDAESERITFPQFLSIVAGNPCNIPSIDDELLEIIAARDDGSGFVGFRDVMRTLHGYLDDVGCNLRDDELLDLYHQVVDASMFQNLDGSLDSEVVWAIFEDEFEILRGKYSSNLNSGDIGNQAVAGAAREPPGGHPRDRLRQDNDQPGWISLTVVDLGGNQLLSGKFVSSCLVVDLQIQIEAILDLPVQKQLLILAGRGPLGGRGNLTDVGVVDGSTLILVLKADLKMDYASFLCEFMQAYLENYL